MNDEGLKWLRIIGKFNSLDEKKPSNGTMIKNQTHSGGLSASTLILAVLLVSNDYL